jgi:hypothetical protein
MLYKFSLDEVDEYIFLYHYASLLVSFLLRALGFRTLSYFVTCDWVEDFEISASECDVLAKV